jgi:hypothetical protein
MEKKPSYHYWHGNVPKSSIPINTAPQKIEAPTSMYSAYYLDLINHPRSALQLGTHQELGRRERYL